MNLPALPPEIVKEVHAIHDELAFARMPALAAALSEIGCPESVVAHALAAGPHVRGCWALDFLLGKS